MDQLPWQWKTSRQWYYLLLAAVVVSVVGLQHHLCEVDQLGQDCSSRLYGMEEVRRGFDCSCCLHSPPWLVLVCFCCWKLWKDLASLSGPVCLWRSRAASSPLWNWVHPGRCCWSSGQCHRPEDYHPCPPLICWQYPWCRSYSPEQCRNLPSSCSCTETLSMFEVLVARAEQLFSSPQD